MSKCLFCILETPEGREHFPEHADQIALVTNLASFAAFQGTPWQVMMRICEKHSIAMVRIIPKLPIAIDLIAGRPPKPVDPSVARDAAKLETDLIDVYEIVDELKARIQARRQEQG